MKRTVLALWLAAAFALLPGCGGNGAIKPIETIEVPATLPAAGKEAQKLVNESNVLLTATFRVIGDNAESGVWTKKQAQGYHDTAERYAGQVDEVQNALDRGMWASAQSQAALLSKLIFELNKEVAAQARKAEK